MDEKTAKKMKTGEQAESKTKSRAASPAARNRAQHNRLLTAAAAVIVLLVLLVNLVVRDRAFSDTENRTLAQKPAFSLSGLTGGKYLPALNDWYNDQFAGRDGWMSLNFTLGRLFGTKETEGVYLCAGGRLIAEPETPDEAALEKTIDAINRFSAEHTSLQIRTLLVPGAAAIQNAYLPKNAPVRDQMADLSAVSGKLDKRITQIDAAASLQSRSEDYIYYLTDHHWTSLGAWYVFSDNFRLFNISSAIQEYNAWPVTHDFEGTLASRSGSHRAADTIEIYASKADAPYYVTYGDDPAKSSTIYSRSALEEKDKYTVFFGGNYGKVSIYTTANNNRRLLLFKDSYANCFVQLLLPYYEEIIMIDPRYYYGGMNTVLGQGVTDVLFLYSVDTLVKDKSLADVLNAEEAQAELQIPGAGADPQTSGAGTDQTVTGVSTETPGADTD